MAHFAKITNDNKVEQVIVVANDDCGGGEFPDSEPIGQEFIASLGLTGEWLQCSYHASFRGCYPGPTYTFDADLGEYGEFVPPPTIETDEEQ
jgi:hypothetical protein